jgi:hypothetical protein
VRLCKWGVHAYRTVFVRSSGCPDVHGYKPSWDHHRRCKHCGWERMFLVWRYPRIRLEVNAK